VARPATRRLGWEARPGQPERLVLLRRGLDNAEHAFVVLSLFVLSSAVTPLLERLSGLTMEYAGGDALTQALLTPVYLGALALAFARDRARQTLIAAARHPWSVALCFLAVLSASWSDAPMLTARRGLALCLTTVFGWYVAGRYRPEALLRLVGWTLGVMAAASLLIGAAWPEMGITAAGTHRGDWFGIFDNKNTMGRVMALGVAVFAVLRRDPGTPRWWVITGGALTGLLVVLSGSMTALVVVAVLLVLVEFYARFSRSLRVTLLLGTLGLLVCGVAGLWMVGSTATVFGLAGRDITLTGRTLLWSLVWDTIGQRPWLGFGFGIFWGGASEVADRLMLELGWWTPHAHNGFLELWLGLGAAGVALFVVGYAVAVRRAVREARSGSRAGNLWPLAFLTFVFLYNLTEHTLAKQGNLFWVLYVATVCSSAIGGGASRGARPGGQRPLHAERGPAPLLSPGVRRAVARQRRPAAATGEV
jgi:exopolysaccharide production protein ExoQ